MSQPAPSPLLLLESINAYQRTAAIRAGIELDVFTAIAEGNTEPAALARRCGAAERGVRILCDYLTVQGFLTKSDGKYALTADSAVFLDSRSPAYLGGTLEFLLSPTILSAFDNLAGVVKEGGTLLPDQGTVEAEHHVWVKFARAMMPMMAQPAQSMAAAIAVPSDRPVRVLDIAAGHGLFGIAFAQRYPNARVTALDWPQVVQVARENAEKAGVGARCQTLPGSAFDTEYGGPYDLVLLTNFIHHFDPPTCQGLLRKVHAALAEGGRAVTLEFVPNEDRVTPPAAAVFSLTMLAVTPSGDAYTFSELEAMFRAAGFSRSERLEIPGTIETVVVSHR